MYQIIQFPTTNIANKWLKANPDIEIVELQYFQKHGATWISVLYKPFLHDERNYSGQYDKQ